MSKLNVLKKRVEAWRVEAPHMPHDLEGHGMEEEGRSGSKKTVPPLRVRGDHRGATDTALPHHQLELTHNVRILPDSCCCINYRDVYKSLRTRLYENLDQCLVWVWHL